MTTDPNDPNVETEANEATPPNDAVAPAASEPQGERDEAAEATPSEPDTSATGEESAPAPPSEPDEAQTGAEGGDSEPEEGSFLPPQDLRAILEALIFASPHPVTPREINNVLGGIPRDVWESALEELRVEYTREGRGLQLVDVAGGMQITTRPEYNDWVRELLNPKAPTRLSIQALETLAVIAYKQPVTLPEVIELRGVKSGGVIKTLLERRLVRITGRKEVVGRPMLYGTTKDFLLHFGLKDLTELPKIEEFAEVLGEEVDVEGLKKAIEAPTPTEVPLDEGEGEQMSLDAIGQPQETTDEGREPEADQS